METVPGLQGQVFIEDVVANLTDLHFNKHAQLHRTEAEQQSACSSTSASSFNDGSNSDMAVDDLEYHITFPSPNNCSPQHIDQKISVAQLNHNKKICNNNKSNGELDVKKAVFDAAASVATDQFKAPVIVLLGWYGCQDRHLAKYSKIYEDLGCITIRFLPKADILIYQSDSLRSIAAKLLEVVEDFHLEQHQVILHIFSNGGCYVYRHICELLSRYQHDKADGKKKKKKKVVEVADEEKGEVVVEEEVKENQQGPLRIQGCIFDSCPAVTSPLHLFRAIAAATPNGSVVYRWLRSLVLMFAVLFAAIFEFLLGFVFSESKRVSSQALWNTLAKDNSRCPQLFLYSKADEICHYKSIKNFAEERRKCGVDVGEVCWDDSPHVKHFIMHRNEYLEHVLTFVSKCLQMEVPLPEVLLVNENETETKAAVIYVADRPNTP